MSSYTKPSDFHPPTAEFLVKYLERKGRQWQGVARGRNFGGPRFNAVMKARGELAMQLADILRMEVLR